MESFEPTGAENKNSIKTDGYTNEVLRARRENDSLRFLFGLVQIHEYHGIKRMPRAVVDSEDAREFTLVQGKGVPASLESFGV